MKVALLTAVLLSSAALAQTVPDALLTLTPERQAQVRDLSSQLRCLVCQGEAVVDSRSNFAFQVKAQIAQLLGQGRSEAEILDFFVGRYGETILLEPPRRGINWIVWGLPALALFGGAAVWWSVLSRKNSSEVTPAMLERVELELRAGRPSGERDVSTPPSTPPSSG